MSDCKKTPEEVCRDWHNAFELFRPWMKKSRCAMKKAFPGSAHLLPGTPALAITCPPSDRERLCKELWIAANEMKAWASKVMEFAESAHDLCKPCATAKLEKLRRAFGEVSEMPYKDDECKDEPRRFCKEYLSWLTGFFFWGCRLHLWENDCASKCEESKADDTAAEITQVTPPPWPPWGARSSASESPTSQADPHSLREVVVALLKQLPSSAAAGAAGGPTLFKDGINDVGAELDVPGKFRIHITIKGP